MADPAPIHTPSITILEIDGVWGMDVGGGGVGGGGVGGGGRVETFRFLLRFVDVMLNIYNVCWYMI